MTNGYTFNKQSCNLPEPFNLGHKGDCGIAKYIFSFDRYYGSVDMQGCKCFVLLHGDIVQNGVENIDLSLLESEDENKIKFEWVVDNTSLNSGSGNMQFKLAKQVQEGMVSFYTDIFAIKIDDSIYNTPEDTITWRAKGAKASPRLEDGILTWYEGDSFEANWKISITVDGEEYQLNYDDVISFKFKGADGKVVYTMDYTHIVNNEFVFDLTRDATTKFPAGEYTYRGILTRKDTGRAMTIYADCKVLVE